MFYPRKVKSIWNWWYLFFLASSHSTRLLAATTLRNVLGTKNLAEILSERETISQVMQNALDEATDPWGVKVTLLKSFYILSDAIMVLWLGIIHKRRLLIFLNFLPPSLPLSPHLSLESLPNLQFFIPPSLPLRGDVFYGWSLGQKWPPKIGYHMWMAPCGFVSHSNLNFYYLRTY